MIVRALLPILVAALLGALLSGCAARVPSGGSALPEVHLVQRDETLYRIARRYGLKWRALARHNAIGAPYIIYPGQRLRLRGTARSSPPPVPGQAGGKATASASPADTGSSRRADRPQSVPDAPPPEDPGGWLWPADGEILRGYSSTGSRRGIAIGGNRGDPVRATRAGEVVYAGGGLVGYGRLVILKHDGRFLSAYGHNDELLVSEGDRIEAGATIARLGSSGAEQTLLHFEIRVDGTPVDPIRFLPAR
ncbi:MAG: peptidoglycan DD-metalloendopeptidase family protein [Pseudomonadota bacterium]